MSGPKRRLEGEWVRGQAPLWQEASERTNEHTRNGAMTEIYQ